MRRKIGSVAVVIPVHDEESTLGACLTSVQQACAGLRVPSRVIVVADHCRDSSVAVAARFGAEVVIVAHANVGAARRAGLARVTGPACSRPDRTWVATTDGDSVVPADWLRHQVEAADLGADAHVGTVTLAEDGPSSAARSRFEVGYSAWARHPHPVHHPHVHGANLGARASAYLDAGGFPPVAAHEDRRLVARLDATGAAVVRSHDLPVSTSSRIAGRARGGVAHDLFELSGP